MENKVVNKISFFVMIALFAMTFVGVLSANSIVFTTNGPSLNNYEVGQIANGIITITGSSITPTTASSLVNLTLFTSTSPDVNTAITTCNSAGYSTSPIFKQGATDSENSVTFACPVTFTTSGQFTTSVSYIFNDSSSGKSTNTLTFNVLNAPTVLLTSTPSTTNFNSGETVTGTVALTNLNDNFNPANVVFSSNPSNLFKVSYSSCTTGSSSISCPITFNSVSTKTLGKITVSYTDGFGVTVSNSISVTVYPPISISEYPTNKNLDIGQNAIINLDLGTGSGSYQISNALFYNNNLISGSKQLTNSTPTSYIFTPLEAGTYNAMFTITDLTTGYSVTENSVWNVYPTPIISITTSNTVYNNNIYSTDASQIITFHVSSTGGTGSPIKVYLVCNPTAIETFVDCVENNIPGSSQSLNVYTANVILDNTNNFKNTTSLQTLNSPATKFNINTNYVDKGTYANANPYYINLINFTITTVPTLSSTPAPSVTNSILDQGQYTYLSTYSTGQYGLLPFTWSWFDSYNGSTYSKTSSTICPKISGTINNVNTDALTALCGFQTSTSTPTGKYNFEVNTTDAANYSLFSTSTLVTVNPQMTVSVSPSTTIDLSQSTTLSANVKGGSVPYSYQWYQELPGSGVFSKILGATSSTYDFVTTGKSTIGNYIFYVNVTDSATTPVSILSKQTTVTVNTDPILTVAPTNTIMDVGQSVKLTSTVNGGTSPYSYKWYTISGSTNTVIPGATSSTYTYSPTTSGNVLIGFEVKDGANFVNYSKDVANVIVYSEPTISLTDPTNTSIDSGQNTMISATISGGTGQFNYDWERASGFTCLSSSIPQTGSNVLVYKTATNYIPGGPNSQSCEVTFTITDTGTSKNATSQKIISETSHPFTVYTTPYLTDFTASNAIIDLGQSETFSTYINGGSNSDMSLSLYVSPTNYVKESISSAGDGTQSFVNFVPNVTENIFYVNGLDSGVTTPFDISPTNIFKITINPTPSSTISASNAIITPDQESTLTSTITGGTPSYTYQWYIKTPGSSTFSPISGATSKTFNFNLNTMTISGIYTFMLSTTDSASTPETFNSKTTSVTVTPKFTSPKLVLNITANIINDPDSGNLGYWALDNISRNMQIYQTTLATSSTTYNSYTANVYDTGIATTFAGAISPGGGVTEPYNGVASLTGFDQLAFSGIFTPGSYPVYTNGQKVASFNNRGTSSYILLGNYAAQSKSTYSPASTFDHYLSEYFTLKSEINFPVWGDTYTYSVYPPGNQVMTDNSISNPVVTGDIVTYQVPTVTLSPATVEVLDYGQSELYSASIYNGIGNFPNTILYQYGSNTIPTTIDCSRSIVGVGCSGAGTFTKINAINISANGLGNVNGNTVSFGSFTPSIGTDTYFVSAFDGGTSPPNTYSFISNTNTIQVYPDPVATTNINAPTSLDLGSSVTVSTTVTGGTGKFSYLWTNTGSCPGFTSATTSSFTYTPTGTTNNCVFNVVVTDIGVSQNAAPSKYAITSASTQEITVNPALIAPSVLVSGKSYDQGETVEITTGSITGGTPPYIYTFNVNNKNLSKTFFTCTQIASGVCSFTATQTGTYTGTLTVTDSASIPSTVSNTIPSYSVNPDFSVEGASTSTNTLINSQIVPVLITANILGEGGTPPYTYEFTVQNATTGTTVFTESTQNSMLGNSIVFNPSNNGIYQATTTIYDNATPSEVIQSSYSKAFLIGSAGAPTAVLTPSKYVVDSGYTDNLTAQVFGGVGPFNVEFYNISGQKQIGSNVIIQSPGESNSISFTANSPYSISLSFNAIVTDEHTGITFNSLSKGVIVNPALGSNLTLSNSTIDIGQPTVLIAAIHGGTPPYSFNYEINGVTAGTNSNVMATDSSNVLVPTISSFILPGNIITKPGTYSVNVIVQDNASGSEVLSNTLIVNSAMQPVTLSINSNSLTTAQSVVFTSTNESEGTAPYMYNFEVTNSSTNTVLISSGYQTSNTFISSASTLKGGNTAVVIVKDAAGMTSTSNTINFNVTQATTTSTTTTPNTGGSVGGGGGSPGTGGGAGGSGTPHPTVLNFTNGTDTGYEITNFAVPATTSVTKYNATFNLLMNFISPTQVGVSVNNVAYTLQLKNQSVSVGTVAGNEYYIELSNISYLPLQETGTVYLYTKTPKAPSTNAKPSNTTTNTITSTNASTNNTKPVNTTANTTSIKTTTQQNTTSNTSNKSTQTNTTQGTTPNMNDNSGLFAAIGAVIVIIIILGILYYFFSSKKLPMKNKK